MSLLAALKGNGATGFGFGSTAEEVCAGLDLTGKTIVITGVNSGLGLESARVLGGRGAFIVGLSRTRDKAATTLAALGIDGAPVECELSEPASVRAAVSAVKALGRPLDALLANAGIMALPKLEQAHGYELQFFTNHVGHFILVTGLLDALSPAARVVVVSSYGHHFAPREGIQFDNLSGKRGYSGWRAYGQSKLANVLFARALAKRFAGTQKTANSLHPGGIATNLSRYVETPLTQVLSQSLGWIGMKSVGQGAATQCYVAAHPKAASITGCYWSDCNVAAASALGQNDALAQRLWDESERIVSTL
jgi:WW domain-containing oxidoreductase